jgi:bacterioferritin-associated ferredoxin
LKTILKFCHTETVIVCVCRGVSDREVATAVDRGARSVEDVTRRCDGAGTDCGSCRSLIEEQLVLGSRRTRTAA